ncbi:MAG: AAA family ATPase [Sulfuricellaceae bacterium]
MNAPNQTTLELPSWNFRAVKLGCVEVGDIEFKPLTLMCGPNNTGKTWVMYALYGFLASSLSNIQLPETQKVIDELIREGQISWNFGEWLNEHAKKVIDSIHLATKQRLHSVFNSSSDLFSHSRFDWEISANELVASAIKRGMDFRLVLGRKGNEVLRLLKQPGETIIHITLQSQRFPDISFILAGAIAQHLLGLPPRQSVFLVPAERNGLHLFYRELANRRTALLHHATKKDKDINLGQLFQDLAGSRYAEPIAHYIDWLNEIPSVRKNKPGTFHSLAEEVKKVAGGRYDVDAEGDITFTPRKLRRGDGETPPKLDLHLTSSTVKSLFGLWFYLEHQAQVGDVLMLDEPELNLHPSNQRLVARLLARLVNSGLRVVVSTHSDYLVREVNSLIMLSREHVCRAELMKRFGYQETEFLSPEIVAAYLFDDRKIVPMKVTVNEGIQAETFDAVIHELNETSDEIYYAYQEAFAAGEESE